MRITPSINKVLKSAEGNLQRLLTRTKILQRLTFEVRQCLPQALSPRCLVANIRDNRLIMYTDTSAQANLLRYYMPNIIKHLQQCQEYPDLRRVVVKVRPPTPILSFPQEQRPPALSQENAALLRNTARRIKDSHLKSAFLRLSLKSKK
ncbi:protein of unknown function DUF721 [Nitrosococcus watsonii C-113]|uniref:DUF721 domain-containing protein n=2 Tax=Nitrosococcus TaxID=1227 RepID=D8K8Z5_NITWC|nr:protein of unknown function DUF721 [Nitrosococcus watsonii C-113]